MPVFVMNSSFPKIPLYLNIYRTYSERIVTNGVKPNPIIRWKFEKLRFFTSVDYESKYAQTRNAK